MNKIDRMKCLCSSCRSCSSCQRGGARRHEAAGVSDESKEFPNLFKPRQSDLFNLSHLDRMNKIGRIKCLCSSCRSCSSCQKGGCPFFCHPSFCHKWIGRKMGGRKIKAEEEDEKDWQDEMLVFILSIVFFCSLHV